MKKTKIRILRNEEWQIEGELILKEEKIYILKDKELRIVKYSSHWEVKVHKIDLEICRLVEQSWLQLMCCTICLLHDCNFR